jgi:hypothetical protein
MSMDDDDRVAEARYEVELCHQDSSLTNEQPDDTYGDMSCDDDDARSDDGSFVFDDTAFASPLTEVARQRHPEMTEEEQMVMATLASEREAKRAKQIKNDHEAAQKLDAKMRAETLHEATMRHRRSFQRRWRCAPFLYDDQKLLDFVRRYDIPYASQQSSPVAWRDKVEAFKRLRNHDHRGGMTETSLPVNCKHYFPLVWSYQRKTTLTWSQVHSTPSIVASQLLTTHVHLYYVQSRGDLQRIAPVVDYVYDNSVSGNTAVMKREAGEFLAVLVQLGTKTGLHHVFDGQFVEMVLKGLLECRVPTVEEQLQRLQKVTPFW